VSGGDHMPLSTKLFIYNSQTHKLDHQITSENTAVNMKTNYLTMESHPTFEHYVLTADHDGQIVVWNI
jgi:WD40 repeat protein